MNAMKILLMTTLLTAVTMTAFGQQGSSPIQPGGPYDDGGVGNPGRLNGKRHEEVRRKIDTVRIWRLTEELRLDPDTSAKLSSILSSYSQQRRKIRRVQRRTMKTLQRAVESQKPNESKIRSNLEKLEKNRRSMQELKANELRDLKSILTIEQQARYIVFQKKFMREMRGMIKNARRGNRDGTRTGRDGKRKRYPAGC